MGVLTFTHKKVIIVRPIRHEYLLAAFIFPVACYCEAFCVVGYFAAGFAVIKVVDEGAEAHAVLPGNVVVGVRFEMEGTGVDWTYVSRRLSVERSVWTYL